MDIEKRNKLLFNLENPVNCQKLIKEYDDLRQSVKLNYEFFDELIHENKKGFSEAKILRKAKRYFPVVNKSYSKMLKTFRMLFDDNNLEFNEIKDKLSELILEEHEKRSTGINKINNDYLESLGIKPELGGEFTSSELGVFSSAFLLFDACRNMLAKLSTIYVLLGGEYYTEGETEEGFQY